MNLSNAKNAKYESPFSIKILDSDFNLITPINYADLQWDRMYHEVGKFVIDGVQGDYNRDTWKYVYTEKRKELGVISQVNWKKDSNKQNLTLSGLFAECDLNNMICYAKPTKFDDATGTHYGTSILSTDAPTWVTQEGTADVVAKAFFDAFKQISFRNYLVGDFSGSNGLVTKSFELDVDFGEIADGYYHYSKHNRNNEKLGNKMYDILKESYASFEVVLDFDNSTKTLNIIHGVDRTQTGHGTNNPILLSTKNGSIKSASIVTSDTETKDVVLQYAEEETQTLILVNALSDSTGRFIAESMSSSQSDFINDDIPGSATQDNKHKLSVMADAATTLNELKDTINIQFDFVSSSYKYMEDFDLGDVVSIEIPEVGVSLDAQIVACHEVVKSGVWSLSLEIGQTILRKRGNM